ncbi:hypothetical protein PHYBLDRAFT_71407 [Phycomyces blakesleeanus NRRL 1555(-)]|uniref:Uncharacterized protein n=1 Tax=Phycomyces blakesleeanus (strain ATCC 8743b / DSM 1359 / FGSC 10004 / NBRC 33097 / NRRL 1555) TaxID=763407 RepID=A0A162UDN7_PHYB8|nr:hypothetical protein PHYBLDRAFT_71407 [Phycomyces blakesleeanus NRRL 1555(-)]OAD74323.1 hypothetical protein PHYBLDRAFT_71407 [Phycomyces blakesleeanus NRRL 1555(-)]|eukprot:XP_018292363.1 hypothetical protein PHYBLDRAFT_71407 [Phycomyces blakesleeanus NRRL 1555(-)]
MSSIKKLSLINAVLAKKTYSNMKMAEKCLTLCLKNQLENMRNAHLSATPLLSMPSQSVSAAIPGLMLKENTSTISHESTDGNNNTDLNDPMCDIKCDSEIESSTSPLVFDFSQPSSVPSNNNAKNLEFMKIINDFDISCQAHEKLAVHLNSILGMSTEITYRVCISYLGKKLLKRFSSIEKTVYDVCQNRYMMFNDTEEVACKHCGEAHYKSDKTDKDSILIAKKTMVQIPLARQIALSLANNGTRHEMLYHHNHEQKADAARQTSLMGMHINQSNTFSLKSRMLQIAMIPGPSTPLDFWSFLKPTLADLKVLQEEGMVVITPTLTIHAKVHVLVVTGDILAVARLACHAGLLFFALDEMHGLCHGIGKQVWGLIGGKYEIKQSLFLPANVLKEIGVAMTATRKTVLTAFHGS